MNQECDLCEGAGEVTVLDWVAGAGRGTSTVGCPHCISRELNEELTAVQTENERLRRILAAVETKETSFDCPHRFNDVDGLNWFDAQRKALTAGDENE